MAYIIISTDEYQSFDYQFCRCDILQFKSAPFVIESDALANTNADALMQWDVTPLLMHWCYVSFAFTHQCDVTVKLWGIIVPYAMLNHCLVHWGRTMAPLTEPMSRQKSIHTTQPAPCPGKSHTLFGHKINVLMTSSLPRHKTCGQHVLQGSNGFLRSPKTLIIFQALFSSCTKYICFTNIPVQYCRCRKI